MLFATEDGLILTVGSDQTDREVERSGITISKQLCAKVVGRQAWRYDQVADHWDRLVLRAHAIIDGERQLYQEGPVTSMLDPLDLIERYCGSAMLEPGTAMFCGTLSAIGSVRPSQSFRNRTGGPGPGPRAAPQLCH